jgi:hypothetical protein
VTGVAVGMILIQIAMNKTKREEEEEKQIFFTKKPLAF